jgi:hypothetical protein
VHQKKKEEEEEEEEKFHVSCSISWLSIRCRTSEFREKTLADKNDIKMKNIPGPSAAIASSGEFNVRL